MTQGYNLSTILIWFIHSSLKVVQQILAPVDSTIDTDGSGISARINGAPAPILSSRQPPQQRGANGLWCLWDTLVLVARYTGIPW